MSEVKLIENFVSWQGEGPDSGRAMAILRFKTCDRNCSWCDTAVKMRISAEASYNIEDIQTTLYETQAGILITGGEPTVAKHFDECVALLTELDYPVANVETNGHRLYDLVTCTPFDKPIKFIYSPKIFHEKDLETAKELVKQISDYPDVYIKVVYEDNPLIINFLDYLHASYPNLAWQHRIWLMPKGTTRADLIRSASDVFYACEKYKFNFSSRSHIMFGFI